jgi:ribulose-5-phosphate 4-epimerase/fuculose-1-phosphate aldolase
MGYAGVDVFFVISGFLMQEICSREIGKKGWVTNFYKKRDLSSPIAVPTFFILYQRLPEARAVFHHHQAPLTFTSIIYYWLFTGVFFYNIRIQLVSPYMVPIS